MRHHPYKRMDRVNELIREEISDIILHRIKDPHLGFVTVTRADVSPDLNEAKVYVSILGEEPEVKQSMNILNKAAPFIRNEVGKRIRLKYIPKVIFKFDPSIEYSVHISQMLESLKKTEEGV
ncbi:MAG: 30S ribosome-binding factor RbfA [bacterium]|nr:30S ribosome-binding factor RbfA [bacterium]